MVRLVKLLTVVIVFAQARQKATAIALEATLSKATGAVTPTRRITYPAKNGVAKAINQ